MSFSTDSKANEVTEDCSFEIEFFENLSRRNPKDVKVLEALAHQYTKNGKINDGLRVDRRIVRHDPENPIAHYNLACSLALKNRKKDAVESLREAFSFGYRDLGWMMNDDDLENLRDYEPFVDLVNEIANEFGDPLI